MFGPGNAYFPNIVKYSFPGVFFEKTTQIFPGKMHVGSECLQRELAAIIYGNVSQQFVNVHVVGNHRHGTAVLIIIQAGDAHQKRKQTVLNNRLASYGKMVVFVGNQPYQMQYILRIVIGQMNC